MTDLATLRIRAGDGGIGRVSFLRLKYVPKGGPDGGNGGDGGDVIIRATSRLSTLKHFSGVREIVAESGQHGGKQKRLGARGENKVIEVPLGTCVWQVAANAPARARQSTVGLMERAPKDVLYRKKYTLSREGEFAPAPDRPELETTTHPSPKQFLDLKATNQIEQLIELTEDGQEVLICQGGRGGRGNEQFKSSTLTTPLVAEFGTYGEEIVVVLELRMLADIGLVGYPNAGKSTLLSVLTSARPKIASYPFTTLEPNLGTMSSPWTEHNQTHELVVADIPGIIEGASQGKGLGYDFLRHVEHARALVYVLAISDEQLLLLEAGEISPADAAATVFEQFCALQDELGAFHPMLLEKAHLVSINKSDVYSDVLSDALVSAFSTVKAPVYLVSAATGAGMTEFTRAVFTLCLDNSHA